MNKKSRVDFTPQFTPFFIVWLPRGSASLAVGLVWMQKGSKSKYVEITKGSLIAKSCPEDQNFIVTRIVSFDIKSCQVVDVEDGTPFNCSWDQVSPFDKKLQFTEPTECYAIWNAKWDPEGTQIEDTWTTTYYKATVFPGMKNKKTEYVVAFAGNEQMKCRVPVVIKYSPVVEFPGVIRGEPGSKHPAVLALFPNALTLPLPPPGLLHTGRGGEWQRQKRERREREE